MIHKITRKQNHKAPEIQIRLTNIKEQGRKVEKHHKIVVMPIN